MASQESSVPKPIRLLLAGASAGAVTKTSVAPLERVKILFQIQDMHLKTASGLPKYTGISQTLRTIFKEEGVVGLYRGNAANCVRIIPVYALKFTFNDTYKNLVRRPGQDVKDLSFGQMMTAGCFAGLCQTVITYPLEVVRTRLSLSSAMGGNQYTGIYQCALTTVRQEGKFALYKGIVPTLATAVPYVGMQMSLYDVFKSKMPKTPDGRTSVQWTLLAGACAGMCAQTAMYPGDVVRRHLQTDGLGGKAQIYKGTLDCIKQIMLKQGVRGLYFGLPANMVKCLPEAGIQFTAYDTFKDLLGC